MDEVAIELRAMGLQACRAFFTKEKYLELDTPAISSALIPESCLSVFKTYYESPFLPRQAFFLTPSPEVYIKPVLAQIKRSVFQLSKAYRNGESEGFIHRPEFTMLEYYTVDADYTTSLAITHAFLHSFAQALQTNPLVSAKRCAILQQDIQVLTMQEAFLQYAQVNLDGASVHDLQHAVARWNVDLAGAENERSWLDYYSLLLTEVVEPQLPRDRCVALIDYPQQTGCLAQEKRVSPSYAVKERWELYVGGIELANCYTELTDRKEIESTFKKEQASGKITHPIIEDFGEICENMPRCSGVALGFDRLLAIITERKSLDGLMYL